MTQEDSDYVFMKRAISLSLLGWGKTKSNPVVGCVVVHNNQIIGEGYHAAYGGPHAEVNAIASVKDTALLSQSTLYVTLEPCCHFGKTPPCTQLILSSKIPKVVVACLDPFPLVSGQGIATLANAGVEVVVGVAEKEAAHANRRFLLAHKKQRPYVIAKWAQTKDDKMASQYKRQISGPDAQMLLHLWRSQESAFLIGKNTFLSDKPILTNRLWEGDTAVRVVMGNAIQQQDNPAFFEQASPILIYGLQLKPETFPHHVTCVSINPRNIEEVLKDLYKRGLYSLVVEGGIVLLETFLSAQMVDEIRLIRSRTVSWNEGRNAPTIPNNADLVHEQNLKNDTLHVYLLNNPS